MKSELTERIAELRKSSPPQDAATIGDANWRWRILDILDAIAARLEFAGEGAVSSYPYATGADACAATAASDVEKVAHAAQELVDAADEAYELPSLRNLKEPTDLRLVAEQTAENLMTLCFGTAGANPITEFAGPARGSLKNQAATLIEGALRFAAHLNNGSAEAAEAVRDKLTAFLKLLDGHVDEGATAAEILAEINEARAALEQSLDAALARCRGGGVKTINTENPQ